jgi:DNA sulfur modification protein DndB
MTTIRGEMCSTARELRKCARLRAAARKARDAAPGLHWENDVWLLFFRLGFVAINRDRHCYLQLKPGDERQIDVLARDEHNVFVVECKSSEGPGPARAKEPLERFAARRAEIRNAIATEWGRNIGRVVLVVAISSSEPAKPDQALAKTLRDKNVMLWTAADVGYMAQLADHIGPLARYQIYSVLLAGKRQKSLARRYPALKGSIAGRTFYHFLIPAHELLQYAHVHHRALDSLSDVPGAYQRMLKAAKLRQIRRYVDHEEGYFPNAVILNFTPHRPLFNATASDQGVEQGTLSLPPYYGSAWVIDGQHRLYGAAQARTRVPLPVMAFEGMATSEQAALFVDINKKQTKVPAGLLWDLYSDIYRGSADKRQATLFLVTQSAKLLASQGVLQGRIRIPSAPSTAHAELTLETVCQTIRKYSPWELMHHPADPSRTPENVARLIGVLYEELGALWPEDWESGGAGVLLSNNGFGVIMMVFTDILRHIKYQQGDDLLRPGKSRQLRALLRDSYLNPVVEYLRDDRKMAADIRKASSRGLQSHRAGIIDLQIQGFVPGFNPPRVQGQVPTAEPLHPGPDIATRVPPKCRDLEDRLRARLLEDLQRHYGARWWKDGLPGGLKKILDEKWQKHAAKDPSLRAAQDPNTRKLAYAGLEQLRQAILFTQNWKSIFCERFGDPDVFQTYLRLVAGARNAHAHARQATEQEVADGIAGLRWFSGALADPDLNPYL